MSEVIFCPVKDYLHTQTHRRRCVPDTVKTWSDMKRIALCKEKVKDGTCKCDIKKSLALCFSFYVPVTVPV